MAAITTQEIQLDPKGFIHRVEEGEPLVIVRGNVAIAEIQPLPMRSRQPRPYGSANGEFRVPDDFDEPLLDEIVKLFEGE